MKRNLPWLFCWVVLITITASCSKDKTVIKPVDNNNPITIGLYQYGADSGKRVFVRVTKVGTKDVNYISVFDTGSTGMTIDAKDIVPDSVINTAGKQFSGDSIVVNGITVTSKQSIISYGNKTSSTKEYGYLAYAPITISDETGHASAKRVPIFIYYKIIDGTTGKSVGGVQGHGLDIFGVGPGTSFVNSAIASPLSYFSFGTGITSGFKLAALPGNSFSSSPTFVSKLLNIGLTSDDLNSSGFIMHTLSHSSVGGVSSTIPSTITYSGQTIAANILFDSGTPYISTIENKFAVNSTGLLPANTLVTIKTQEGFTYTYTTTSTTNLTAVENPNVTGDSRTILGIDFFIKNQYLTDYAHNQIGLKND